jgi:hypothetical protein
VAAWLCTSSPSVTCMLALPRTHAGSSSATCALGLPDTQVAAQAPRVRWGLPSTQSGSQSATCPHVGFFDNNNSFFKFINDDNNSNF